MAIRSLLLVALILLAIGGYLIIENVLFIRRGELVIAKVTGESSMQLLERSSRECSAYSKSCGVQLSYTLKDGTSHAAELPLPTFTRTKQETIKLFVDPQAPDSPRMASLHIVFRNPVTLLMLGFVFLVAGLVLRLKPAKQP